MKKIKYLFFFYLILFFLNNLAVYSSENKKITSIGNEKAEIVVKVFSSLSCPHCATFHGNIFPNLKEEFVDTNFVRFEHHSFPLDLQALNAEKVLKCFDNNEKRFEFLNEIYQNQEAWYRGEDINSINIKIAKIAENYNLNNDKINACLNDKALEDEILNERINGAKNYSIKSTPTIFINNKKYDGKYNYNDFRDAIKKLL